MTFTTYYHKGFSSKKIWSKNPIQILENYSVSKIFLGEDQAKGYWSKGRDFQGNKAIKNVKETSKNCQGPRQKKEN